MNNITISDSICSLYPTCKWTLSDNDYSTLWWDENNQFPIPNLKELEDEVKRLQEEYEFNEYQRQRAKEYPSFADQFDISEAKNATKEIDNIYKEFVKKYGKELPIEVAQQIKVKTGQALRKYYDRMSSASIEGTKQGVRYLKDKIVEEAPQVGNINARLSNLYKFDQALSKASGRIGNLNLLGLPSKIGGAVGGMQGAVAGKILELLDAPAVKSGLAISLDKLTKGGSALMKGGKVPLANLLNYIVEEINSKQNQ